MARNIDSLLKKKGWTGEEVGKALVASIVHDIKHQKDPDYKPLFSQSDFEKMESSLSTERDYLTYGVYRDLYSGLIDTFNRGQGLYQQFYNGFYRYLNAITDGLRSEEVLEKTQLIPYVMTESEYSNLKDRAEAKLKAIMLSYSSVFFNLLSDFMEDPETAPDAIRTAIEASKEEAVSNQRILSSYNEVWGLGYYQLQDGTRSDELNNEEWQEKVKEDYLKRNNLRIDEREEWDDLLRSLAKEIRLKSYELFYRGYGYVQKYYNDVTGKTLPDELETSIMDALEQICTSGGELPDEDLFIKQSRPAQREIHPLYEIFPTLLGEFTEWHDYSDPPTNLTKYDILVDSLCFYNGEESETGEPELTEFMEDYPALYKALEAYIHELIPKAQSVNPSQYNEDLISWGDLSELKGTPLTAGEIAILDELSTENGVETTEDLLKRKRIFLNGFVIAQDPRSSQLTENGEFINTAFSLSSTVTFGDIDSVAKNDSRRTEISALRRNLMAPALRYLYAFNSLVKILGSVYDIEEMGEIELSTSEFERQMDALNSLLYIFYGSVYGTPEEKERKRDLINGIFFPLDYENLRPSHEAIEALKEDLTELGISKKTRKELGNFNALIEKLCEGGL